jgi:predicted Zn-dependent peptidase
VSREFSKILYGDKSAYSSYFTENSLKSINQEDLVAFHKTVFRYTKLDDAIDLL